MKKLIMFVMVVMLCLGTASRAQYTDYIGAGQADDIVATASSEDYDSPTEGAWAINTVNGSGLTGDAHDTLWETTWTGFDTDVSPNPARGDSVWIHYDLGHVYGLGLMHVWNGNEETGRGPSNVTIDYSVDGTSWTELGTFNDWPEATGSNDYTGFDGPDFAGASARYVLITVNSTHGSDEDWTAISEIKIEVGVSGGVPNPIIIDANDTTVYEPTVPLPFDSEGNFTVSLSIAPEQGSQITARIDPNGGPGGGNPDLTLLGSTLGPGDDPCDNRVWLTFTPTTATDTNDIDLARESCDDWDPANNTSCWNTPLTVQFVAVDDAIPEPEGEGFDDPHQILVKTFYPPHPTDANYANEKSANVTVIDNDKADILFTITPAELSNPKNPVTGPVQIWEQPRIDQWGFEHIRWRNIGVTLQVEPKNDENPGSQGYVRLIVTNEGESGNQPIMDPNLIGDIPHRASEPNAIVFTSGGTAVPGVIGDVKQWDDPYLLKIWGNDDDVLQIEEAFADGDEDYHAWIVFYVDPDNTSDARYTPWNAEEDAYHMEREVVLDIEDNDCGAFGYLPGDIAGDPARVSDPNNPDCYLDIYDVIEMATRWFNCTEPLDPSCWE